MPRRLNLGLALLLTVATGFSGLVYEVAWQKYLAILLGSHSEATATVLGIFLAGLALGYALFGQISRRQSTAGRRTRVLLLYAVVEGAIGLYALIFPWLFRAAHSVSLAAPAGVGGLGFAFDVGLTALLIGPPTVLMGGTIPLLTQALARDLTEATRVHAWVYAFNTAGAFAGALAAGFVLVPALGLDGVLTAMSLVNLAAAGAFAWLGRAAESVPTAAAETPPSNVEHRAGVAGYCAVAALTGFAMMALQTVVIRMGGLAFGVSPFTFSMVVAVFVLSIALGSLAVSLLPSVRPGLLLWNQWLLALGVGFLYVWLDDAPYWVHVLRTRFGISAADFRSFHLSAFWHLLLVLGPPVLLSGASLPLLFHHARRGVSDLGQTAGRLYSWNTVGSLFGALLGGYALLFWLDLHAVYRLAAGALVVAATLLGVLLGDRRGSGAALVAGALVLAGLWMLAPWDPRLLASGLFRYRTPVPGVAEGPLAAAQSVRRGAELVFHEDDPTSTVTVNEWRTPGRLTRSILTNGKPDGTIPADYPTMALAGIVPALLAEKAERAFVIGWGTGISAGELAALDSMREVAVVEISGGVLRAAPLFDYANLDASKSPKLHVVRSDAYRALLRSPGGFDVIVSEPSNPWVSGVEMLFSREFLEAARDRLAPGGVFAQWYHQYETDAASLGLVLRTYVDVFDHVAVWFGKGPDLFLLGLQTDAAALDLDRLIARASGRDVTAGLQRSGVEDFVQLLAHELLPLGVVHALALEGPVHTLTHPRLSDAAARAFFRGRAAQLPFSGFGEPARLGAQNSLLRRHLARLSPAQRRAGLVSAATETCAHRTTLCGAWLGAWYREAPGSAELDAFLDTVNRRRARFGGRMPLDAVPEIAELLGPLESPGNGVPLDRAQGRTGLFTRFYLHAQPFASEALLETWRRCQHPQDPGACQRGLDAVRRLLAVAAPEGAPVY